MLVMLELLNLKKFFSLKLNYSINNNNNNNNNNNK